MEVPDPADPVRRRMINLMRFLKAFQELRYPPKRRIDEQPWLLRWSDLPDHPDVAWAGPNSGEEWLLRVRRPAIREAPEPPPELAGWLDGDWRDPFREPRCRPSRPVPGAAEERDKPRAGSNAPPEERFEHDHRRTEAWRLWKERWDAWARAERPARQAMRIFERLHELHALLEREGERYELLLGDGLLVWRLPDGGVCHPVLLKRVQITFDADKPEFVVCDDRLAEPELYSGALPAAAVPARAVAEARDELADLACHPLGDEETADFLRRLAHRLSRHGDYVGELGGGAIPPGRDWPFIGRAPVLFLRERVHGFSTFFEEMARWLDRGEKVPQILVPIVGGKEPDPADGAAAVDGEGEADVLFARPWNKEQLRIARRLERFGAVVVQGPPGTGKTHTIANLIGHFLAQGKSVLVTAWTAKALRVVRDKVVPNLQPLCVSVLQDDMESRRQLEASVEGIVERLSREDPEALEQEALVLAEERRRLQERIAQVEAALVEARGAEYRSIAVGGQEFLPSEAARYLAQWEREQAWIPGPVEPGAVLPLSWEEIRELYRTNADLSQEEEAEFAAGLPDLASLPKPQEVQRVAERRMDLGPFPVAVSPFMGYLWTIHEDQQGTLISAVESLLQNVRAQTAFLRGLTAWEWDVVDAGAKGGARCREWECLFQAIDEAAHADEEARVLILRHEPALAEGVELEKQRAVLEEIITGLQSGGKVGWATLLVKPVWRKLVNQWRVRGRPPRQGEEFQALARLADLQARRAELERLWKRLVVDKGGPTLGDQTVDEAAKWKGHLERLLAWHRNEWASIRDGVRQIGFLWDRFIQELNRDPAMAVRRSAAGECLAALERLAEELAGKREELLRGEAERKRRAWAELAATLRAGRPARSLVAGLAAALENLDASAYQGHIDQIAALANKKAIFERRATLLERLRSGAPGWAEAIASRSGVHGGSSVPGDPGKAWLWRQLAEELARRAASDPQPIQEELAHLKQRLLDVTAQLIDKKAWAAQLRRVTTEQRQALVGWKDTMRKVGKAKRKLAPKLLAEAGRLMAKCRTAVPVWIMPLTRVVEQFHAGASRFDVVIIDEASQCDVRALAALCLGKTVIVVGDHEQVTPDAIGIEVDKIQGLIGQHLQGVPNNHLYDGQTSIYDLARQSFSGLVTLLEHFRCVPDIIAFSNWLSYDGRIRPLREAGSSRLAPVVPLRVQGASRDGKVNEEEAKHIVSLIAAMMEHPAYKGKTLGAISLVGAEQARRIEEMLRRLALDGQVPWRELESRCFRSGTAAEFQGDERDVMFLSLVDVPTGGPLPLRDRDDFKKRFNVAASRAKDQLWVVHSLDPANDLKPGDLRRHLIQYARDPGAFRREAEEAKAESELERQVIRELRARGYRVLPQYPAGYYRIDIVVQDGSGRKVAIECDGDRWHPPEKLHEDLERQAVLERLGWRFFRVRGTEWFRAREGVLDRLLRWLDEMEIAPAGEDPGGGSPTPPGAQDPVVQDLLARAQSLRRAWGWEKGVRAGAAQGAEGAGARHPGKEALQIGPVNGREGKTEPGDNWRARDQIDVLRRSSGGELVRRDRVFFISDKGRIHIKQTCPFLMSGKEYVIKTTSDGNEALLAAAGWCPACGKTFREGGA